jgi:O-antigen/teichoic acid export membrane protein
VIHRSDVDDDYLNTAWTIQVARGFCIGGLIFCSAHPLALAFSNLQLEPLFRVVSLGPILQGFNSTNYALADRNLQASRRVRLDLYNQLASVAITALLAWGLRSTIALAWGSNLSLVVSVLTGHWYLSGPRNRFRWSAAHARAIVSVGRISLLTSALTFAAGDGSRLLSGTMVDSRALGLISLAAGLATMPWQAIQRVAQRVLLPAYAELSRGGDIHRLRRALLKARAIQVLPSWVANFMMVVLADWIFGILYDARYAHAAHILQIQSLGMMVGAVSSSYGGVLWGMGRLKLSLVLQITQSALLWLCIWIGYVLGGPIGLVIGSSVANWAAYPFTYLIFSRLQLSSLLFDMAIIVPSTVCAVALFCLLPSNLPI